jgi:predicted amidohydrolase
MPECALPGYPGAARPDFADVDWQQIGSFEADLAAAAHGHGVVLVLGTASPDTRPGGDPRRITNDALVVGAGVAPLRYRKQCLTPGDMAHFVAGDSTCWFDCDGWRFGLAICYDLRFPDVWARLAAGGCDGFLCLAHLAGADPDPGTKAAVLPALCTARAAELATPLVLANTAAPDRWLDSGAWDARGVRVASGCGLLVSALARRTDFAAWYSGIRDLAMQRWRCRPPPL